MCDVIKIRLKRRYATRRQLIETRSKKYEKQKVKRRKPWMNRRIELIIEQILLTKSK